MAMDDGNRRQAIVTAITAELERQGLGSKSDLDVEALAGAIERALDPAPPAAEGRHPDQLNATNDD